MLDTIEDMLPDLNSRIFLLDLQREFVWSPSQIEMLFNSLMRDYPIDILIRWNVRRAREDYYETEIRYVAAEA